MQNFNLSEHYTFFDLTNSDMFPELVRDNRMRALINEDHGGYIIRNLIYVCENILEPIYDYTGYLPRVLSGYRYNKLNRAVRGAAFSWHKRYNVAMKRGAVDFTIPGGIRDLFFDIAEGNIFIPFHKLIYYKNHYFIHISLPTGWKDDRVLIKDKGKFKVIV